MPEKAFLDLKQRWFYPASNLLLMDYGYFSSHSQVWKEKFRNDAFYFF